MSLIARVASAAALTLALAPVSSAAIMEPVSSRIVIDDFESGDFELSLRGDASTTVPVVSTNAGASILGGTRRTSVEFREGGGQVSAATFGAALGVGTEPGGVLLLSDSFNALGTFTLSYDNLGGVDLTGGGTEGGIAINFRGIDGVSRVFVRVDSGSGSNTTRQTAFAFESDNASASLRDSQALFYSFADYANVDFTNVNRIVVGFDNIDIRDVNGFELGATDIAVDSITTIAVPEPASVVLAAAGLGLLAGRRNRKA